jgi:hypothetical protein
VIVGRFDDNIASSRTFASQGVEEKAALRKEKRKSTEDSTGKYFDRIIEG